MADGNRYTERLTRGNCAAVLVDFLTGFAQAVGSMPLQDYQNNVAGFCLAVKALDIPFCVLGDEGGFRGEFFPLIKNEFKGSNFIARATPSAWDEPQFRDWAESTGRKKIVLGGFSIDNCTMLTALGLLNSGYEAYVVTDASGAENKLIEETAIARLVQAGGVTVTWLQFACEVMGDWRTPYGPKIGAIINKYSSVGAFKSALA